MHSRRTIRAESPLHMLLPADDVDLSKPATGCRCSASIVGRASCFAVHVPGSPRSAVAAHPMWPISDDSYPMSVHGRGGHQSRIPTPRSGWRRDAACGRLDGTVRPPFTSWRRHRQDGAHGSLGGHRKSHQMGVGPHLDEKIARSYFNFHWMPKSKRKPVPLLEEIPNRPLLHPVVMPFLTCDGVFPSLSDNPADRERGGEWLSNRSTSMRATQGPPPL